jgi:hypothetical protein
MVLDIRVVYLFVKKVSTVIKKQMKTHTRGSRCVSRVVVGYYYSDGRGGGLRMGSLFNSIWTLVQ